jgi:hypothetical protein
LLLVNLVAGLTGLASSLGVVFPDPQPVALGINNSTNDGLPFLSKNVPVGYLYFHVWQGLTSINSGKIVLREPEERLPQVDWIKPTRRHYKGKIRERGGVWISYLTVNRNRNGDFDVFGARSAEVRQYYHQFRLDSYGSGITNFHLIKSDFRTLQHFKGVLRGSGCPFCYLSAMLRRLCAFNGGSRLLHRNIQSAAHVMRLATVNKYLHNGRSGYENRWNNKPPIGRRVIGFFSTLIGSLFLADLRHRGNRYVLAGNIIFSMFCVFAVLLVLSGFARSWEWWL